MDLPKVQSEQRCLHWAMGPEFLPFFRPFLPGWRGLSLFQAACRHLPGLESPWLSVKVSLTREFFPTSLLLSKHIAL